MCAAARDTGALLAPHPLCLRLAGSACGGAEREARPLAAGLEDANGRGSRPCSAAGHPLGPRAGPPPALTPPAALAKRQPSPRPCRCAQAPAPVLCDLGASPKRAATPGSLPGAGAVAARRTASSALFLGGGGCFIGAFNTCELSHQPLSSSLPPRRGSAAPRRAAPPGPVPRQGASQPPAGCTRAARQAPFPRAAGTRPPHAALGAERPRPPPGRCRGLAPPRRRASPRPLAVAGAAPCARRARSGAGAAGSAERRLGRGAGRSPQGAGGAGEDAGRGGRASAAAGRMLEAAERARPPRRKGPHGQGRRAARGSCGEALCGAAVTPGPSLPGSGSGAPALP